MMKTTSMSVHAARSSGVLILLAILCSTATAQSYSVDFKALGSFTTPSLEIDLLTLTADDGSVAADVNVLNFNGLGVVGGLFDSMCDSNETLTFSFDQPVVGVRYAVFVANNLDADNLVGEALLEAFDGATSLGVIPVNDTGFKDVTTLFGGVPITSFTVSADGDGNRIDVLQYTREAWSDLGHGLAGTNGVPELVGTGFLESGAPGSLVTTSLLQNHVAVMVLGVAELNAPFKGGVFVPQPNKFIYNLTTGANGRIVLPFTVPAGLPSGFTFYAQTWLTDPAGVLGFAASNAISGTTP